MTAELQGEKPTERRSRYDGDALESMTPQATERPPFSSKAEGSAGGPEQQGESIKAENAFSFSAASSDPFNAESSGPVKEESPVPLVRLRREGVSPPPEDSGKAESEEGSEPVPCITAELELEAQLEVAMRRCEMLEMQNTALWQVCSNHKPKNATGANDEQGVG